MVIPRRACIEKPGQSGTRLVRPRHLAEPLVEYNSPKTPLKKVLDESKSFYSAEFRGERFFTMIYGAYAYGTHCSQSDLDMVTVCSRITPARLDRVINFTLDLHIKHGMEIDDEVPHQRKLLASFEQLDSAIHGEGFQKSNGRVFVPPVIKTPEFLDSEAISLRLLLNVLTGKSILVDGDKLEYLDTVRRARENLVALLFSIENLASFTINSLVSSMVGTEERNGEMYLGYKNNPSILSYLKSAFKKTLSELVRNDRLQRIGKRHYALKDHAWFISTVFDRPLLPKATYDFSTNATSFGVPSCVGMAAKDLASLVTEYPEQRPKKVLSGIAAFMQLPNEYIYVSPGSSEFFFAAPRAFGITSGIVTNPSFWFPSIGLKRAGVNPREIILKEKDGFRLDLNLLAEEVSSSRRSGNLAVYLCNPNNPTGNHIPREEILSLTKEFPEVLFIIDETYLLFVPNFLEQSISSQVTEQTNLLSVFSLSKFFNLPGARMGCVLAAPSLISRLETESTPFAFSSINSYLLNHLFEDSDFVSKVRIRSAEERTWLMGQINGLPGITTYPSPANFFMSRFDINSASTSDLIAHLAKSNMQIRDCNGYGGLDGRFFRVSARTRAENQLLFLSLKEYLGTISN